MNIAISGSGVAVYPPGATFGPRVLPDFEFVWLLQGTAEWRYDQGTIALGTNSLLLGRPGMRDRSSGTGTARPATPTSTSG